MKEKNTKRSLDLFGKSNYTWMIIGAVLIIAGMLLMENKKKNKKKQSKAKKTT